MNSESIKDTILRILGDIVPNADIRAIDPNVSFHDQFELDSIDFLRLMMELEKTLSITIMEFDYPRLSTLQGCENYLGEKLAAGR